MKSYRYLVNKHIKIHRKRSILTMIGIVSSIILFFTIGYIMNYSEDVEQIDYINVFGDYDVIVYDVEKESAKKLNDNVKIDKCGFYDIASEISIDLGNVKHKMVIYELDNVSIDNIFYEKLNIKEGRTPKSDKEIILNYSLKNQLGVNINDKFNAEGVSYSVVGFYEEDEYSISNIFNGFTYLDKKNFDEKVNAIFKVKNKYNKIRAIETILRDSETYYGDINDRSKVSLNHTVYGNSIIDNSGYINIDDYEFLLISLKLVVLFLTIVLTYGSINISLNERKKEFAALRCIGATPTKIKKLLIKESIILSLISLIPGIIIAQIISWIIIYTFPNNDMYISYDELNGKIYIDVIINTIIFIAINIFIATIIPLRKVGKLSPIEAIKNNDINNKGLKIRNSKLIRKVFGYSGELAYKNIRANNKNFIITILTLSTILIVTICFSGYKILTDKLYNETIDGLTDINITFNQDREENTFIGELIRESKEFIGGVERLNVDSEMYTSISINKAIALEGTTLNKDINENINIKDIEINGKNGIYAPYMSLLILDEEYINKIVENINANGKKIDRLGRNDFIVVNTTSTDKKLSIKRVPPINATIGDTINLYLPDDYNFDNTKETVPIKINYAGTIESKYLIGMNRFGYYNSLTLIVSEDFYLQNQDSIKVDKSAVNILLNLDKNQNKEIAIEKINNYVNANNAELLQEKESEIELNMKIKASYPVIYTGLVLLILICSINLINIRSMNTSLREKEFKILLAIGMKKSKLNKIIFLEGIVAWFISSVIGGSISIIVLIIIKSVYMYQGYLQETSIPFYIVIRCVIMLLLITIIISIVPYRKLKNIELNNLIKDNE